VNHDERASASAFFNSLLVDAWPKTLFKPGSKMAARRPAGATDVAWNFEKFLVGRDGAVVGRFGPDIEPQDKIIVDAVEAQLAA
jgi:glutathione peroxidase